MPNRSNRNRGRQNNNPEGRNQYSNSWMDTAKDRPVATAAAAAAAVGAGVFLWSRRNQISDQISNLTDQVTSWAEGSQGNNTMDSGTAMASSGSSRSATSGSSGSTSGRRSGSRSGRSSGALDEIGVIEVDTVTL